MATEGEFATWVEPFAVAYREHRVDAVRAARAMSESDLDRPTGDEGWSVREEMLHIAASDGDFIGALSAIIAGGAPDMSLFADIDGRNARNLAAWQGRSMDEVATAYEKNGRALQGLLARLTDEDESRQPEGMPFAISQLIAGYGQHGPYHLGQVRQALGQQG
jgi:uncharacterized damage-inducible protein DinB